MLAIKKPDLQDTSSPDFENVFNPEQMISYL